MMTVEMTADFFINLTSVAKIIYGKKKQENVSSKQMKAAGLLKCDIERLTSMIQEYSERAMNEIASVQINRKEMCKIRRGPPGA